MNVVYSNDYYLRETNGADCNDHWHTGRYPLFTSLLIFSRKQKCFSRDTDQEEEHDNTKVCVHISSRLEAVKAVAPAATTPTQTTPTDSDHQQYFAGILEKNPESIQIINTVCCENVGLYRIVRTSTV